MTVNEWHAFQIFPMMHCQKKTLSPSMIVSPNPDGTLKVRNFRLIINDTFIREVSIVHVFQRLI